MRAAAGCACGRPSNATYPCRSLANCGDLLQPVGLCKAQQPPTSHAGPSWIGKSSNRFPNTVKCSKPSIRSTPPSTKLADDGAHEPGLYQEGMSKEMAFPTPGFFRHDKVRRLPPLSPPLRSPATLHPSWLATISHTLDVPIIHAAGAQDGVSVWHQQRRDHRRSGHGRQRRYGSLAAAGRREALAA